jgi:hypothetical protein
MYDMSSTQKRHYARMETNDMTEELKTERLNLILTPTEMDKLQELADANTGKNKSLMARMLIELAWDRPKKLGLHLPKVESPSQLVPVKRQRQAMGMVEAA